MRTLLFFAFLALLTSCKQQNTQNAEPALVTETNVSAPRDTISEQTFLEWTHNWDSLGRAFTDTLLVEYFDMPLVDLAQTLGESPAEARFFHGLEDLGGGNYKAHIVLAGIDANGIVVGNYFDISQPCPPICKPPRPPKPPKN
ncbi:MAG: hypothetical protein IPM42_19870 [Saprospiraceae bacterium]|nr:hypothetical protein [Saprospiraceae bacterium]